MSPFIFRLLFAIILICPTVHLALADETLKSAIHLPGASVDQEVTYHPSKSEYESVRTRTLDRLKAKDPSARVNPSNGPWMLVETTAMIGIEYHGVGVSNGRKHVRKVSAAEEALYMHDKK
jgi:hypothetical protein